MKKLYPGLLVLVVFSSITFAQVVQKTGLTVRRIVICEDVKDREPAAIDSVFTNVERLCCFTEINGADEPTHIQHVWYHGNKEMLRIKLSVRASHWRTYSAKRILSEWTGNWRVDVIDDEGRRISQSYFQVK